MTYSVQIRLSTYAAILLFLLFPENETFDKSFSVRQVEMNHGFSEGVRNSLLFGYSILWLFDSLRNVIETFLGSSEAGMAHKVFNPLQYGLIPLHSIGFLSLYSQYIVTCG